MIRIGTREFNLIKGNFKNYILDRYNPLRREYMVIAEHIEGNLTGNYIIAKVTLVTLLCSEIELKGFTSPFLPLKIINFQVFDSDQTFGSLTDANREIDNLNNHRK